MNKISSITIAKNESGNLERCLKSLKGVVDEIIVAVDNTSTDNTFEIAEKYADVALHIDWQGYSGSKIIALNHTTNKWVLWIDADEELTDELKEELISWKESSPSQVAFKIARRAFFLNKRIKHCGWYPGYVTRLFNKERASFSENTVHEHLVIDGETGKLNSDLNHYTDPDLHHYFEKFNKYTSLAADELHKAGRKASLADLLLRAPFMFIKMYLFRLGFLDGINGLILSVLSSTYVFTKYAKLMEKQFRNKL